MDKFIAFTTVTVENELENKRENKEGVIRAGKMSEGMIFRDNSIIFLLLAMLKDNKGSLNNVRVLKKTMIFLQSYDEIIPTQSLKLAGTFAPCGKVETVKTKQNFKNTTSYVTFAQKQAAAVALIAFYHLNSRLRVLFGTVQYCKYFMRKAQCRNDTCVFLHVRDKKNQIIVNDQIDEDVYDDHYDMALRIAQETSFKNIKHILQDTTLDDNHPIKKGLKKASLDLNIQFESDALRTAVTTKQTYLCEQSTEQSELPKRRQQIQRNEERRQQSKRVQSSNQNFSEQDYIKIRLIKKLIRQNNSKFYTDEGPNHQQICNRSKMMLYQIVKN